MNQDNPKYEGVMLISLDKNTENILFNYFSFDKRTTGLCVVRQSPLNLCRGQILNILQTARKRNYKIMIYDSVRADGFDTDNLKPLSKELEFIIQNELNRIGYSFPCPAKTNDANKDSS